MCDKRSTVTLKLSDKTIRVDSCMREKILALNENGITTLACCCGHGIYTETIVVSGGIILAKNVEKFVTTSRIRNFYKKDTNGYYYIPEVSSPKECEKNE
jgi:hypothetical protein